MKCWWLFLSMFLHTSQEKLRISVISRNLLWFSLNWDLMFLYKTLHTASWCLLQQFQGFSHSGWLSWTLGWNSWFHGQKGNCYGKQCQCASSMLLARRQQLWLTALKCSLNIHLIYLQELKHFVHTSTITLSRFWSESRPRKHFLCVGGLGRNDLWQVPDRTVAF